MSQTETSSSPRWRERSGERGISLPEMLVAFTITLFVMIVVLSMIEQVMLLSFFTESHNDLAILSQRSMNVIQKDLLQERQVFSADALGNAYRDKINAKITATAGTPAVAAGSVLPVINVGGTLSPDTGGVRQTGNSLLIARQLQPFSVCLAADGTDPVNFPAVTFLVDRYQFEYFYLTEIPRRFGKNGAYTLDLMRFRSFPFADYFQLGTATSNLSVAQRQALSSKIQDPSIATSNCAGQLTQDLNVFPKITVAWNPGQAIDQAFYTIDANLAFPVGSGPLATATVDIKPWILKNGQPDIKSMFPEMTHVRLSGNMDYTIAYRTGVTINPTQAGGLIPGQQYRNAMPQYFETSCATTPCPPNNSVMAAGLPLDCGFEVKVVGQIGFQQILSRMVMYSNYQAGRYDQQEGFVITSFSR